VLYAVQQKLGEVDGRVLALLASSSDTSFSFQGIKRSLKLHQEKLSRSLGRLTDDGLVVRGDGGYSITRKGVEVVGGPLNPSSLVVIGNSYLPKEIDIADASAALKRRWFRGMRWLGSSPNPDGIDLKWVTDDGEIQVQASFTDRFLEVSLISFPPHEEGRAREVALRLFVKIINVIYEVKGPQDN